jgi:ABC-type multidrug transport system fused ATPase/permease subunit
MTRSELRERYLAAALKNDRLSSAADRKLLWLSLLRLLVFAGGAAATWAGFGEGTAVGFAVLIIAISLFVAVVIIWQRQSDRKTYLQSLARINSNEADALEGNLSAFDRGDSYADPSHDFSHDIDIFGEDSLFQYLNRTVTGFGRDILAGWISDPFPLAAVAVMRQKAVGEMAEKERFRHEFMAAGMKTSLEKEDMDSLLEWLRQSGSGGNQMLKKTLCIILPLLAVASLILAIIGTVPYTVFTTVFLGNLLYIASGLRRLNRIHASVSRKYNFLSSLSGLLRTYEKETFASEELAAIGRSLAGGAESASAAVRSLSLIIQAFDTRLNIIAGLLMNGLFLWDYNTVLRLDRWKSLYRERLPLWLEMAGRTDAYISLGNYAYNNPSYVFSVIRDGGPMIDAARMGHPLIHEDRRICNDFALGTGQVCIITGANMAGKSTFLRTVAVNYVLAMTGAPVCAAGMSINPARLYTGMRTSDSLSHNESYFYAELRRLGSLKERLSRGEKLLFLLDEILKGTNSADKSRGSRMFLEELIRLGASGLIATHDISLGDLEASYRGVVLNRCFETDINDDSLTFDYLLRDGVTSRMNATHLMKQMGLLS